MTSCAKPAGELCAQHAGVYGAGHAVVGDQQLGQFTYSADAYGQPVTQGVQVNAYDALGRLVSDNGYSTSNTLGYVGSSGQIAADGSWLYSYDPAGTLAGIAPAGSSGQATLAYTDAHTDVVGDFAPAGAALAGSATYDPLGSPASTAGLAGTLGYQSGFTDTANGFVRMGARWYWPGYSEFTTRESAHLRRTLARCDHGTGDTAVEGTKFASNLTQDDGQALFNGLVNRISEDNATDMVDATGNHEHILAWPGAGSNGENFVRVWMTSDGELGSMWPILGP